MHYSAGTPGPIPTTKPLMPLCQFLSTWKTIPRISRWLLCIRAWVCPSTTLFQRCGAVSIIASKCTDPKGAFTPDANEALRANYLYVKSMQRRDRQSCGAIRANEAARMTRFARIERLGRLMRDSRALTNQDLALAVT